MISATFRISKSTYDSIHMHDIKNVAAKRLVQTKSAGHKHSQLQTANVKGLPAWFRHQKVLSWVETVIDMIQHYWN